MVKLKKFSPIRVMGRHVDCSCSVKSKVSLYSCTVSLTMLMLVDPDSDPLAMLTIDVSWEDLVWAKSDPTSKIRNL